MEAHGLLSQNPRRSRRGGRAPRLSTRPAGLEDIMAQRSIEITICDYCKKETQEEKILDHHSGRRLPRGWHTSRVPLPLEIRPPELHAVTLATVRALEGERHEFCGANCKIAFFRRVLKSIEETLVDYATKDEGVQKRRTA